MQYTTTSAREIRDAAGRALVLRARRDVDGAGEVRRGEGDRRQRVDEHEPVVVLDLLPELFAADIFRRP